MKKGDLIRVCYADNKPIGPYYRICSTDTKAVYCNQIINGTVDTDKTFYLRKSCIKVIPHTGINVSEKSYNMLLGSNQPIIEGPTTKRWKDLIGLKQSCPDLVLNLHYQEKCLYFTFITAIRTIDSCGDNGITCFGVDKVC